MKWFVDMGQVAKSAKSRGAMAGKPRARWEGGGRGDHARAHVEDRIEDGEN